MNINRSDSTPSPSTPTQIAEIATHQPSDPSMNVPDDEEDLESELEVRKTTIPHLHPYLHTFCKLF